ncbi:MAG TPA: NACHT domain-containing protein [Ktedonosporobacter sp.]|jgi:nucleoside phosphorylase|nr:NACHT domain-containing protein [Ktedonosporobacter sp.]
MGDGIPQCDVCIICALAEETEAVLDEFSTRCQTVFEKAISSSDGYVYHYATIRNQKGEPLTILVLCQAHPGPVETVLHLKSLLREFHPRFAAMAGICAGEKRKVQLGDLVVAEYAYHYEEGKVERSKNGTVTLRPGSIPYSPAKRILQYAHNFKAWQQPVAEQQLARRKRTRKHATEVQCFIAPMASGMAVRTDDPFPILQQQHRKTLGLDQEAAAFYATLHEFPDVCSLVVKGVCDYAHLGKNDVYHEEAAHAAAIYLLSFIQEYVTEETMPKRRYEQQPVVKISCNHIAAPPGKLFDRVETLAEIERCLKDQDIRGIFLWGMRGCGKSLIAKKIAEDCKSAEGSLGRRFSHIVWLTFRKEELTATGIAKPYNYYQSKHDIYAEILKVHGSPHLGNMDPLRGVQEVLQNAPTLVILDSFEFFLEGKREEAKLDSDFAALLREVARGSCFVLTSWRDSAEIRRYLYKVIKIEPFDAPLAKEYFLYHCKEKSIALPSPQWSGEVHKEIFKVTAGIPLALELVANYVHNIGDVKTALADITSHDHYLWRYIYKKVLQQLQKDEWRLLVLMILFKSPLDKERLRKAARLDDANGMKKYDRALARLRHYGLLNVDHEDLYLHDTLREYIMNQMGRKENSTLLKEVQKDFIDWALAIAEANEKWEVYSQQANVLAADLNNLIAALEILLSEAVPEERVLCTFGTTIAHYLHINGRWTDAEQFFKAILSKMTEDAHKIKVQVLLGRHYAHQEKTEVAKRYLLPAMEMAESIGDETLQAEVYLRLGQTFYRSDPSQAWQYLEKARDKAARNNDYDSLRTRISTLSYMAELYMLNPERKEAKEALKVLEEADSIFKQTELEWDRVRAHLARLKADACLLIDDKVTARECYLESRRLSETGADGRLLAWNYLGLAEIDKNLEYAKKAQELFETLGLNSQVERAQAVIDELASM